MEDVAKTAVATTGHVQRLRGQTDVKTNRGS